MVRIKNSMTSIFLIIISIYQIIFWYISIYKYILLGINDTYENSIIAINHSLHLKIQMLNQHIRIVSITIEILIFLVILITVFNLLKHKTIKNYFFNSIVTILIYIMSFIVNTYLTTRLNYFDNLYQLNFYSIILLGYCIFKIAKKYINSK